MERKMIRETKKAEGKMREVKIEGKIGNTKVE